MLLPLDHSRKKVHVFQNSINNSNVDTLYRWKVPSNNIPLSKQFEPFIIHPRSKKSHRTFCLGPLARRIKIAYFSDNRVLTNRCSLETKEIIKHTCGHFEPNEACFSQELLSRRYNIHRFRGSCQGCRTFENS